MTNFRFLPTTALAALALFATTAAHAQGLGGMLNKTKAKVGQATSPGASPSRATAATQAGQGTSGELPDQPNERTVAGDQAYTRAWMADTRPVDLTGANKGPNYYYKRLRQEYHMPLTFTWDEPAVQLLIDKRSSLWGTCEDIANDLVGGLYGIDGPAVKPLLPKVKQIHLTTTPKRADARESPFMHGFFLSFNPATGVLTAAMSIPDGTSSVQNDGVFEHWIIKHVK